YLQFYQTILRESTILRGFIFRFDDFRLNVNHLRVRLHAITSQLRDELRNDHLTLLLTLLVLRVDVPRSDAGAALDPLGNALHGADVAAHRRGDHLNADLDDRGAVGGDVLLARRQHARLGLAIALRHLRFVDHVFGRAKEREPEGRGQWISVAKEVPMILLQLAEAAVSWVDGRRDIGHAGSAALGQE